MQNLTDTDDLLGLDLSLTVSPVIAFNKGTGGAATTDETGKFQLIADAALQYTSLNRVLNGYLAGKRFDISEGLFAKHVVVKNVSVSGSQSHALVLNVNFTGSFTGSLSFAGTPVYNEESATILLLHPRYDLQTGNLLLKGAKLLFAARIEKEMKKATRISVSQLLEQIENTINENLNKEWGKGLKGTGEVKDLRVLHIQALPEHLLLKATCDGSLQITISEIALHFKR